MKNIPIGELLKEKGYITEEQLTNALSYQKEHRGMKLGQVLMELDYVSEYQLLTALSERLQTRLVDISQEEVSINAVSMVPKSLAQKYMILPVSINQNNQILRIVTNDPLNYYGMEDIRQLTGCMLVVELCAENPLKNAIDYYYSEIETKAAASDANESAGEEVSDEMEILNIQEADGDAPIIKLLNTLILRGNATGASDIHIEPFEERTVVRMRIDGIMLESVTLQKNIHQSLITRIKIVSNLDIAEKRIPQDGHFRAPIGTMDVNIRVSVIPTVYGEKAVLRLLNNNSIIDHKGTYGMEDEDYEKFQAMLKSPNGIIYLTGPTGSGKTTTLYMALEKLVKQPVNICTIEDPVEKNIAGISQMQVNQMAGLTFESGLRALLRQDPDIIMVGETRDAETASISVRAAITGHQVFSTLHTNSAIDSIIRLQDMGLEPYMVANSVVGIVAQRLMRKVCPECAKIRSATPEEQLFLGDDVEKIAEPQGCNACNGTGYHGRTAIHEIILIDKEVRRMIAEGSTMDEIQAYALKVQHMKTLKMAGIKMVKEGVTTLEELHKITYYTE